MNKILLVIFTLLTINEGFSQNKFILYFTDKNNNPYSVSQPNNFLTQRAIDRRQRQGLSVNSYDLPVTPKYVDSLKTLGINVWYTSRWFNAAIIETDANTFNNLLNLGFVRGGDQVIRKKYKNFTEEPVEVQNSAKTTSNTSLNYGQSLAQVQQIGADEAHDAGYKGEGMIIGVLDSGFRGADTLDVFDTLFAENRVLGTFDFVNKEVSVYEDHNHGMNVLSTMAAYLPGQMIGTAPKASYYLFRTEDVFSEYWVEETNWLVAAEKADSLGVDVINTSLGYTTFDETQYNHSYSDMDGNTTIISRAADMASKVGILVNVSAGNEGGSSWYYISAPADADSVLTVGAVNSSGNVASFSSRGPTSDNRIKPNLCATGWGSTVATNSNTIGTSNGTSFSGPILCGMATCFWQANPNLTNYEVIDYLQRSGTNATNTDYECGFGIPHFTRAQLALASVKSQNIVSDKDFKLFFSDKKLVLNISANLLGKNIQVIVYDNTGKKIIDKNVYLSEPEIVIENNTDEFANGIYLSYLFSEQKTKSAKITKFD